MDFSEAMALVSTGDYEARRQHPFNPTFFINPGTGELMQRTASGKVGLGWFTKRDIQASDWIVYEKAATAATATA